MATAPTRTTSQNTNDQAQQTKPWAPPAQDQEFTFESIDKAPAWVDKNWASFDRGPALALPAGDLYGQGPYHTVSARVGDKVVYTAAKGAMPPKFTVIPGDPAGVDEATPLPPQQSGASLEDLIKQGYLAPSDMGAAAKAEVASRSPRMAGLVNEEDATGPYAKPEKQSIGDQLLTE